MNVRCGLWHAIMYDSFAKKKNSKNQQFGFMKEPLILSLLKKLRTVVIYQIWSFGKFENHWVSGYIPRLITGGYLPSY